MRGPRPSAMSLTLWSEYEEVGKASPVHATPHAAALHCSIVTCWEINAALPSHGSLRHNSVLTGSSVFGQVAARFRVDPPLGSKLAAIRETGPGSPESAGGSSARWGCRSRDRWRGCRASTVRRRCLAGITLPSTTRACSTTSARWRPLSALKSEISPNPSPEPLRLLDRP